MKNQIFFRIVVGAFVLLSCRIAPAQAAAPEKPAIEFGPTALVARVTPGASIVFFGVGGVRMRERHLHRTVRWQRVVVDDDRDGLVSFDLGGFVPAESVWAVVDVSTGNYALGRPQGVAEPSPSFEPGKIVRHDGVDTVVFARRAFDLLCVDPAKGAWAWADVTQPPSGAARGSGIAGVTMTDAKMLAGGDAPPSLFSAGSLLIAVDDLTLEVQVSHVSESGGIQ